MANVTASDVLSALAANAGEREKLSSGAMGSGNYISVNEKYDLQGKPYCGTTIRDAFERAGCDLLKDCSNPAYVPTLMGYCKDKGWQVSKPEKGCIFAYKDDHVGMVYEVSGSTIITLEGNATVKATYAEAKNGTGESFEGIGWKKRTYDSNYTFYLPPYGSTTASTPATTTTTPAAKKHFTCTPTVDIVQETSTYSTGACKSLQTLLNAKFGAGLDVDGEFGPLTKAALTAAQDKMGVDADGNAGKDTWTALLAW